MSEYKEKLIDRMTAIYGLEDPIVIEFCRLCEKWEDNDWNNKILRYLVEAHEAHSYYMDN